MINNTRELESGLTGEECLEKENRSQKRQHNHQNENVASLELPQENDDSKTNRVIAEHGLVVIL